MHTHCFLALASLTTFGISAIAADLAPHQPETRIEPSRLLSEAVAVNGDLYASLESFVCQEQMERYSGKITSNRRHRVDRVSAKVSLENGSERYSDLRRENRSLRDMTELDGAWSEGEFGTLLRQTEQLLNSQYAAFTGEEVLGGKTAVVFRLDVPADSSPWDLTVSGQHYRVPFVANVWLDRDSKKIVKIQRTSTSIPQELRIAEIDWAVTLAPVELNGKVWLLPDSAEYQVGYRDTNRREWNEMKFLDYHRYTAETTLRFN